MGPVTNLANQPDLRDNLFPVETELDRVRCAIIGELPEALRGAFLRNGPNPMFEPISSYHMFDGDGMLHEISFDGSDAFYRNRWIQSRGLGAEMKQGRALYPGLSEVMHFPDADLVGDAGPVKNPANTHIIRHADRYLALWEGGLPTQVTASLETIGEYDFDSRLVGAMTAHPRIDPRSGELFFFGYSLFEPYLRYHVADASGALIHSVDIELPAPVMMHDFIITEQHAIFLDSPIVFDIANLGVGPLVQWRPENGCRIGVMPRYGSAADVRWFEIEAGHVQHFWNGWVEGDRIEFSGTRFDHPEFGIDPTAPLDETTADATPAFPARFWVDLSTGKAGWEQTDDLGGDFCRFDDRLNGVRTRHHYMSAMVDPSRRLGDFDAIVHYDAITSGRAIWNAGSTGHVGESVFAPDPQRSGENEGWLLNAVYDDSTDASELCVFDAQDVASGPIARVQLPRRVPFGFHANWFAAPS
ncbi:MAG: carotenoid oxygenase family protein [Actinomycetes bacterium]